MNARTCLIGILLAGACSPALANDTVVGRVRMQYVQVARGVFIERRVADTGVERHSTAGAPRWVDIVPAGSSAGVLALEAEGGSPVGSHVEVKRGYAQSRTFPVAEMPRVVGAEDSRVVRETAPAPTIFGSRW